jgi:hypothetical protein
MTVLVNFNGSFCDFFGLLLILVVTTWAHSLETEGVVATHGNPSKYRLFSKVNFELSHSRTWWALGELQKTRVGVGPFGILNLN